MEGSGTILFFGDTSTPVTSALLQLLGSERKDTLLSKFLTLSKAVLCDSIEHLPLHVRQDARRFAELYDFTDPQHAESSSLRVLSPALLVIAQLGQFISWYETHPRVEYPSPQSTVYIGLCVGQISASAISLSRNLLELIPLAVEAVRLAVNLGSLVFTVRDDLEYDTDGAPWALMVENKIISNELLDSSLDALELPRRKQAYVSATFEHTTTIQGPPTTLATLKQDLISSKDAGPNTSGRPVGIFAPYHAPHLYTEADVLGLIDSSPALKDVYNSDTWSKAQPAILSTSSGSSISVASRHGLLTAVLNDILVKPIEWKSIIKGAISSVRSLGHNKWETLCFGPLHSQKSLVASIGSGADVDVSLADTSALSANSNGGERLNTPIAIVGMAGRFPDADSVEELWKLLSDGIDCHKVIPSDRFDPATHLSKDTSIFGNFMTNPGLFDARFFNMSPREAMQTDPQQRLALVTAYEALEMAGYVPGRTPSTRLERVGSFFGQTTDDYKDVNVVQDIDTYYVSGVVRAFGPGRVSRANQLGGPCLSVDTACSSSATALNLACTSIWSNECDTAVVGGMMLLNSPDMYAGLARGHFTSDNGPCKTFDDEADGYCRGETVASVVLKRLDAAQADKDNILGVILAGGANYSAYAASITQPHAGAQESLFRKVLRQAAVHPFDIDYVELHGTGTQLGDSVEMTSVTNVLAPESPRRPTDRPLYVGSVKANIGHGESASGISALIKALLLFQKENIPPHVGVKSGRLNRKFPALDERRVKVAEQLVPFSSNTGRKRKILINNFGAAGTNSSLLLEEGSYSAHSAPMGKSLEREHLISITAKSATSLIGNLRNLAAYLERNPQTSLLDLAYTTTARRVQHPLRVSIVAPTIDKVKTQLVSKIEKQDFASSTKTSNILFAFTGQGSLYRGVGKQYFEHNTLFRTELTRFERIATDQGFPCFLSDVIHGTGNMNELSPVQAQLCHVAIQMALFKLWSSWNVLPSAVIGHSLGEYAALYAAGVLSANDTLYLVGTRASLLESHCTRDTHAMLAVNLSLESVQTVMQDQMQDLEISCFNGPRDVVLSGPGNLIQDAERHLKANGIKCTVLTVPYAFHSSQVEPTLATYEAAASHITFSSPRVPVLSTLLGEEVTGSKIFTSSYLARHAREPVRYVDALTAGQTKGIIQSESVFLELGPHPVCLGLIGSTLGCLERLLPTLRRQEDPFTTTCKTLASLNTRGYDIDWNEYHNSFEDQPRLLNLPAYAFDEKKYWIDYKGNWLLQRNADKTTPVVQSAKRLTTTVQDILSTTKVEDKKVAAVFESDLADPALHALIAGHVLNGVALCPSGVFSDIALTVANYFRERFEFDGPVSGMNVVDLHMMKPVTMPVERPNQSQPLRISAHADLQSGRVGIQVGMYNSHTSELDNNATCHVEFGDAQVWLRTWNKHAYLILERMSDLERGVARGITSRISHEMVYKLFSTVVDYDTKYHGMQEVIVDSEKLEAVVSLSLYRGSDAGTFFCSPLWLDNLAQIAGFVMNAIGTVNPREFTYISHGIDTYQIAEDIRPDLPYRAHVRMIPAGKNVFAGDVSVFQGDRMVACCGDVKFQRIPRALIDKILSSPGTSGVAPPKQTATRVELTAKSVDYVTSKNLSFKGEVSEPKLPDLKALISSQIGISTDELLDDSKFDELGVDSLLSMAILSHLQDSLEIQLPASLFTDFPTFGEMQDYVQSVLRDQSTGAPTPGSASPGPTTPPPLSEYKAESESHSVDARLLEVYTIIADEIGVDVQEVLSTEDLSVLGLDSMMAISIAAALGEKLGVYVPSDFFGGLSSTKDVHNALSVQFGAAPQPLSFSPKAQPKTGKRSPSSRPLPPSILLQETASAEQTLFLFPDGSGLATAYAKIPPISSTTRVWGLNSPLLNSANSHLMGTTIEALAAEMLREVRARQPRGPYLLGGWSAGGMFAFEAARQVLESGEQVTGLLLIDSPCRLVFEPMPSEVLELIAGTGVMSSAVIENFEQTIRAVERYGPGPLSDRQLLPTMLIWAEDGLEKELDVSAADLDYDRKIVEWLVKRGSSLDAQGWDGLIPEGSITIQTVPGSHFSMMQAPNTTHVRAAIARALQDNV